MANLFAAAQDAEYHPPHPSVLTSAPAPGRPGAPWRSKASPPAADDDEGVGAGSQELADAVPDPRPERPRPYQPPGSPPGPRRLLPPLPPLPPGVTLDRRAVIGLTVLLLLAVGYAVQHFWLGRPQPVTVPTSTVAEGPERPAGAGPPPATRAGAAPAEDLGPGGGTATATAATGPGIGVVVDVAGRVAHPGLRRLPAGARVADALAAAGGPLPDTDTQSLNLARMLTDGEQILVGAPAVQSAATGPAARAGPLSLNRATVEQLDTLPGVGPTLAQRIVQFRLEHGSFRSIDQLRQVSGIGARKYEELKALLAL